MDVRQLQERIEVLERENARLRQQLAEALARGEELEKELRRRGKNYRPRPNAKARPSAKIDRRKRPHRSHGGHFRPTDFSKVPEEEIIHHDVYADRCPQCGGRDLETTGQFDDHYQEDLPEPKVEIHRYRRHESRCRRCGEACQGRGDLELPDAHIGPRARLLVCYARAELGISLGKTTELLRQWWQLPLSRAGALGHLRWGGKLFAPVVQEFLELLRQSNIVHADETGWRIDGKNVWAWCLANPHISLYLIDRHRSSEVFITALGESLPGVLVSDFYAAYNCIDARKQRCLPHLLRELHKLRQELSPYCVRRFIVPLIELFQDAIALGHRRQELSGRAFARRRSAIRRRFRELLDTRLRNKECLRIWSRLFEHENELFTFLDDPSVPSDNNHAEREIRGLVAARQDGGTHRRTWSAEAFARIKTATRSCRKNGRRFLQYGLSLIRALSAGQPAPLPFDTS